MANHGGNMAKSIQGHRAYLGHKKHITPNKKHLVHLFMNKIKPQDQRKLDQMIKNMHARSLGSPVARTKKSGRDVIAFPVPECMCTTTRDLHTSTA
ncbi:O-fucosyltransferase family protein [Thalictrum thalictroides]|uniref:O-fucosyltransferase family protein n=1 Tax=Thalictrum thalictroides TaxID=46969 RepID=A0A7J6WCX4_THATH|nr:O-fucosyltransferase family protein [Thalictrum thalictroides]